MFPTINDGTTHLETFNGLAILCSTRLTGVALGRYRQNGFMACFILHTSRRISYIGLPTTFRSL